MSKKKQGRFKRLSRAKWEAMNRNELDRTVPGPSRNTIYDTTSKPTGRHTTLSIGKFDA